jgi:acyl carrier protein
LTHSRARYFAQCLGGAHGYNRLQREVDSEWLVRVIRRSLLSDLGDKVQTKQEIFERLRSVLVELFEIDPQRVTLEAHLYHDLEIDSIDTIDLILKLKDLTGRKIQPEQFRHVRTVGDAVEAIYQLTAGQTAAA